MWGKFPSTSPRGAYIRRGNFNRWFFALRVWGAYTWRDLFSESYGILQKTVIGCPCVYCERFISHSDSMIKMLSGNKKIYFSDFNCTHGHMWPLMWKSSLWFAVFARIAMCMLCISCSNGSGYPWEKKLHPFEQLGLSVGKTFTSVHTARAIHAKKICIRSNGLAYPCEKNCHPFEQLELSIQNSHYCQPQISLERFATWSLGQESHDKPVKKCKY